MARLRLPTWREIRNAFVLVAVWQLATCINERANPPIEIVRPDTVAASGYRKLFEQAEKDNKGLRAQLEGVKELKPVKVTVYDTIITRIVEPVTERVVITDRIDAVILRPDSGGYVPVRQQFQYKNCDDRLELIHGTLHCDPARLGHLTAFVRAGVSSNPAYQIAPEAEAGLHWQPYYRSTSAVELFANGRGRASVLVRLGLRIF